MLSRLLVVALVVACSTLTPEAACAQRAHLTASTSIYTRADTNATTVWSPRTALSAQVTQQLSLQAVYAVDAWTSASIDIVTAATAPVHEVRHELSGGVAYEVDDLTLSAGYRYSTENDYWSHGGVLQASLDLFQHNTTLAAAVLGSRDVVGHALEETFREQQNTLGGRLAFTQVLDASMWAQLSWETLFVDGYQASPYRFVATGGLGTCHSRAPYCTQESVPDERFRHALVVRARRALTSQLSMGLDYRFYIDSWRVQSQTIAPALSWLPAKHSTLSIGYRYYTQREADFYRPRYLGDAQSIGYVTRDKELSALFSHRLSLEYARAIPFSPRVVLSAATRVSVTRFHYLAFVGLSRVDALEATLLLALDFR